MIFSTGIPRNSRYSKFAILLIRDSPFVYQPSKFAKKNSLIRDFYEFWTVFSYFLDLNYWFCLLNLQNGSKSFTILSKKWPKTTKFNASLPKLYKFRNSRYFEIRDGLVRRINREFRGIPVLFSTNYFSSICFAV